MDINTDNYSLIKQQVKRMIIVLTNEKAKLESDWQDCKRLSARIENIITYLNNANVLLNQASNSLVVHYSGSETSKNKASKLDNAVGRVNTDIGKLKDVQAKSNKKTVEIEKRIRELNKDIEYYKRRLAELQLRDVQ